MAAVRDKDNNGDGEKSSVVGRWLHAVRYVVSAVVIVVIVGVAAKAIKVVLRPNTLALSVAGGCVYTQRITAPNKSLEFNFNLQAENPSGRARMYYSNITAYLFDNNTKSATTASPSDDCLTLFLLADMVVVQNGYMNQIFQSEPYDRNPENIDQNFFDALYKPGGRVDGVTMRLDGTLVTELRSGHNDTTLQTYYCRQLIVGLNLNDEASVSSQATSCTTS